MAVYPLTASKGCHTLPDWKFADGTVRYWPAWLVERSGSTLGINDAVRKSVLFLGIKDASGAFAPYGTGFLTLWSVGDDGFFTYLVTAKHVLEDIRATKRPMVGRVNSINGKAEIGTISDQHWQTHLSEPKCDIAVCPFIGSYDAFDIRGIPLLDGVLTDRYISDNDVGCGDEVFTVGLLVSHFGRTKNVPIVRIGNIAAMPEEKVDLGDEYGHQQVYLIESRSIGGLSGSPVFLHTPPFRIVRNEIKNMGSHQREYLMGVHVGLFETKANADSIRTSSTSVRRKSFLDAMSSGIGIVVPIQRIIEIIADSPTFQQHRAVAMKKRQNETGFVPTSAKPVISDDEAASDEKPNHREDFTSLLNAAAQKQKQDD